MSTKKQNTTTPQQPETTPNRVGAGSDAWILLQIGELSGSIKALTQSIDHLSEKVGKLETSTDVLTNKVGGIEKKIYAATAIIALIVAVGGYFANKAIDFGLDMAKQANQAAFNQAPPTQQPPQSQSSSQQLPVQQK